MAQDSRCGRDPGVSRRGGSLGCRAEEGAAARLALAGPHAAFIIVAPFPRPGPHQRLLHLAQRLREVLRLIEPVSVKRALVLGNLP